MTYTKGPWAFTHNSWERSTVYDADGFEICEVNISFEADEETQDHFEAVKDANARLIAAAPSLLEALEALVGSFEKHRPKAYWDAARAAIALARGEAGK